jgi:hypothetical protein
MPTKEQGKYQVDLAKETHDQRSGVITGQLLHALGRPEALYRVEVRSLWEGHYRANVFVGTDATSTRLAHSFFLVTDADGKILTSEPDIARQY